MDRRRWQVRDYVIDVDPAMDSPDDKKKNGDGNVFLLLHDRDPAVRRALREVVALTDSTGTAERDESQWEEALSFAAFSGFLRVERVERTGIGSALPDEAPEAGGDADELTNDTPTTWIGLSMVDQDGVPVSGVRYRVTLGDGTVKEGTIGSGGTATISGLDPGTCKIEFPDLDAPDWKAA